VRIKLMIMMMIVFC